MKSHQDVQEELFVLLGRNYLDLPLQPAAKIAALLDLAEQNIRDARVVKLLTQEALNLLTETPNSNAFANCHALLSHAFMETGDNHQAIHHAHESLKRLENNQVKNRFLPIRMLSIAHRRLHDFRPALTYALEALDIAESLLPEQRTKAMSALANLYLELEYYPQAINMICHALDIAIQDNQDFTICALRNNLAFAYLLDSNLEKALSYAEHAKSMAHDLNAISILASVYETLGRIHLQEKKYAASLSHLLEAARYAERGDLQVTYQSVLRHIAQVRIALGHPNEAAEVLEEALEMAIALDDRAAQSDAYEELATIYYMQGRHEHAFRYLQKHASLVKELSQAKSEQHLHDLRSSYETKHAQDIAAIEQEKNIQLTKINERLANVNAQLEANHEEQRNMVTMLTHDLKNPLTLIMGYPELAKYHPDKSFEYLQQSLVHAQRMYQLIVDFLELSSLETGMMTLDIKQCNLTTELKQVVEEMHTQAEDKKIKIKLSIPDVLYAYADKHAFQRVIENLLSNAIKYSWPQSQITISMAQEGASVIGRVHDEGEGLSKEDLGQLFKKFTRLSSSPTAGEHSSGLGLATCKHLLEKMQGQIWATSQGKGKGCCFYFSLPVN